VFSVVTLILGYLSRDTIDFGMIVTAVGGLWSASVPVAIGCYSDKAKAENEIKLSQAGQLEVMQTRLDAISQSMAALQEEVSALRKENNALKRQNKVLENKPRRESP